MHRRATYKIVSVTLIVLAIGAALFAWFGDRGTPLPTVALGDGKIYVVEAVTFGTNHVVGRNAWWRKVLPRAVTQFLPSGLGQARMTCSPPMLVVWLYARDARTRRYVDCQGITAAIADEHGNVYRCRSWSRGGTRGWFEFSTFPRRPQQFTLRLSKDARDPGGTVKVANPAWPPVVANWTPEDLPAVHEVNGLRFILESLVIRTQSNGVWPTHRYWAPEFELRRGDQLPFGWGLSVDYGAIEDATGNRGTMVGLHEPLLRFTATAWPHPEQVVADDLRWELPFVDLSGTNRFHEHARHSLGGAAVRIVGLFPPGTYTFRQGVLTNTPNGTSSSAGTWTPVFSPGTGLITEWQYGSGTNPVAFLRLEPSTPLRRLGVGLRDETGRVFWSLSGQVQDGVTAFVFELPSDIRRVAMEVVLIEAVESHFVVKPPAPPE